MATMKEKPHYNEIVFLKKVNYNNLNPADKECAGYEYRRGGELEKIQEDFCCLHTKVLLAPYNERRKLALETIREKRSKKRNDRTHSTNIAPDQFDSPSAQNEFSQTFPLEPEKQGVTVSLRSFVIEDLFKDDYVYKVSNEDSAKEQQQQSQEPPVPQQSEQKAPINVPLEQPCEEPTSQQSEQEGPVDVCPPKSKKQGVTGSLTSFVIEELIKDDDVYEVFDEEQSQKPPVARQSEQETLILSSFDSAAQPREREDERLSFNLGISPPASQPKAVVDAGVTAALKFAEATTSEPSLPAAEVHKTPEKNIKITNDLIEKCYHWMTHVKRTRDGSNEYEAIFVLKHEALYKGLREYFVSNNFMLGTHGASDTDKRTNKAYMFDIEQYAYHCQFLDKRKLASYPFLFVPICNGAHWWLWIIDVNKKKFYVLDPINKLPENIPDSRKKLNKFVMRVYAGAEPLIEDGLGVEAEYILLNDQRTDYDCGIYVMKWLETIDPQKIKSKKRYKYRAWTQGEIDCFRYQYGPHILLHKMNKIRDQVIWESEAIRLPKPSAALSSPYCKFTYEDLDSK
ncbi:hypothetical protein Ahy_A07g036623 [Arachis hypogaea]|uniref:Ubiquitin-like protease family profile domain-containing protein n=1 Tax=Arachis hypogaea TaxID=3818 RepID=A0A445CGN4_ARAHY|nr:hypothetical protein Ahy_A07g036623 [Arachis hypogaea]